MDGKPHDIGKWDMMIAHPPCTYLSNAGACRMYKVFKGERYINESRLFSMREGRKFFLSVLNADIPRIAVENPTPMKICELPTATQTIQPWQFGDPYSKRTLLWLKGLPPLLPTDVCSTWEPWIESNTSAFARGMGGSKGVAKSQRERSRTFPGIARAMAEQWG